MTTNNTDQMNEFPSGFHRYAGDPVHLRFRLVFTTTHSALANKQLHYTRTNAIRTHHQSDMGPVEHADVQQQASYLLTKNQRNDQWHIREEQAACLTQSTPDVTSQIGEKQSVASLAAVLKQKGFKLRVMSVPTGSSMKCHGCKWHNGKDTKTNVNLIRRRSSSRETATTTDSSIETRRIIAERTTNNLDDAVSIERTTRATTAESSANSLLGLIDDDSKKVGDFFLERRRAIHWISTLRYDVTSTYDCWKRTQARKLATNSTATASTRGKCSDQLINANDTVSLLMRNHYRPLYVPCQCSRIPMVLSTSLDKTRPTTTTTDNLPGAPLICERLCYCISGGGGGGGGAGGAGGAAAADSGSNNKGNRNSLDRNADNLKIPPNGDNDYRRCLCGALDYRAPKIRYCRCCEFSEGYKCCLKAVNRFEPESRTIVNDDPLTPLISSLIGLNQHQKDIGKEKTIKRKLAKMSDKDREDDNVVNQNSCTKDNEYDNYGNDNDMDSLMADLGISQETSSTIFDICGTDFLSKRSEPARVENSRSNIQSSLQSQDASASELQKSDRSSSRQKLKPLDSEAMSRHEDSTKCRCDEAHGETLLVFMEKYTLSSVPCSKAPLRPQVKASSVIGNARATDFRTDGEINSSSAVLDSQDKNDDGDNDEPANIDKKRESSQYPNNKQGAQSLQSRVRQETKSEFERGEGENDQSPSYMAESLGMTGDSGAINSAINASVESARSLGSNKTILVSQDYGLSKQRQSDMFDNHNRPDSDSERLDTPTNFNTHGASSEAQQRQMHQSGCRLDVKELDTFESDRCDDVVPQIASREHSILLAVIVVDAFNGTIQLKPDLNQLIMVDLPSSASSSSSAMASMPSGVCSDAVHDFVPEIDDTRMIHSTGSVHHDTNGELSRSHSERLFYHVSSVREDAEREACEHDLSTVRSRLGLIRQVRKYSSTNLAEPMTLSRGIINHHLHHHSQQGLKSFDDVHFISPVAGDISLRLQLDIHYAQYLPSDCLNVFVRYRIYASFGGGWQIKKHQKAFTARATGKQQISKFHDSSSGTCGLQPKPQSSMFIHQGDGDGALDSRKLEHMTHQKGVSISSILSKEDNDVSLLCDKVTTVGSDEERILGGSHHKIMIDPPLATRRPKDLNGDTVKLNPVLLHEGSTVTSTQNSLGCFNFCCIEQLMLELSKNNARTRRDSERILSAHDKMHQYDDDEDYGTPTTANTTKRKEISDKIVDEQKSSKVSDERQSLPPGDLLVEPSDQMMLRSEDCLQNDGTATTPINNATTAPTITTIEILANVKMDEDDDKMCDTDKAQVDHKSCARCNLPGGSSSCSCKSRTGMRRPQKNHTKKDNLCHQRHDDDEDVCEIKLIFELYSSDFSGDTLRGWSSMNVPVSLLETSQINHLHHPSFTSQLLNDSQQLKGARDDCVKHNRTCTRRHNLPVIRPALCAPMDRLRYFLLGELPERIPDIESFANSNNRYMTHTQHCGKLVLDCGVTRQFG